MNNGRFGLAQCANRYRRPHLSLSYASALTQRNGPAVAWTQSRDRDGSAWGLRVEMQFNATPVEGSCDVYRR